MRAEVRRSLVSVEPVEGGLEAVFVFAPELEVFAGHFPGRPLVPGVYLIEGVRTAVERVLGRELRLARIADARFTAPVAPGDAVRFDVRLTPEESASEATSWVAKADLACSGVSCAKLRLRLGGSPG